MWVRENRTKAQCADCGFSNPGAAGQAAEQLPFVKRRKTVRQSLHTISSSFV
jgi:hypothetical protein